MEKLKSKSAKSKKHKSKIKGEKRGKKEKQKGGKTEKNGKMDLSICFFFAFLICFLFAFVLLLFCFFPGKKQKLLFSRQKAKKSKIKAKQKQKKADRKSKKKATNMQMDKSIFSLFFLFASPLFSHLFCFLFFSILKSCFLIFHVFSFFFVCFFSSLKNIRTSGRGEHKISGKNGLNCPSAKGLGHHMHVGSI